MPRRRRASPTLNPVNRPGPPQSYRRRPSAYGVDKIRSFIQMVMNNHKIPEIASVIGVSERQLYRWQANLIDHGGIANIETHVQGRKYKLTVDDEEALLEHLKYDGWKELGEMVYWLEYERGVTVSRSTVSRLLERNSWNKKKLEVISSNRSDQARRLYLQDIERFPVEDLIFLDETIFDEKTGWRSKGWAPIGDPARYKTSRSRGKTHACLAAISVDGWLPCYSIIQGYYNKEAFADWLREELLPFIERRFGIGRPMVIIMDNCSTHVNQTVQEIIERGGHLVRYLPPYSPDYNPIELTFATLKAWIRRWFWHRRQDYGTFKEFLHMAVEESGCDRFVKKLYRHAAGGRYLEAAELDSQRDAISRYETARTNDMEWLEDSNIDGEVDEREELSDNDDF